MRGQVLRPTLTCTALELIIGIEPFVGTSFTFTVTVPVTAGRQLQVTEVVPDKETQPGTFLLLIKNCTFPAALIVAMSVFEVPLVAGLVPIARVMVAMRFSLTDRVKVDVLEPALFVAVIVKRVDVNVAVGAPTISPVSLSSESPAGSAGEIV